MSAPKTITNRERQIVQYVAEGFTSAEIATALGLSVHTVRNHRKNIMRRLNLQSAAQMVYLIQKTSPSKNKS